MTAQRWTPARLAIWTMISAALLAVVFLAAYAATLQTVHA